MVSRFQEISLTSSVGKGRTINSGYRGARGWLSFRDAPIAFESTLERDFLAQATADPDVVEIISQPFTLRFTDPDGRRRRYTPDYLVRDSLPPRGGWIVEIKYVSDLVENGRRLLPGLIAARIHAALNDMRFTVLTEKHIRGSSLITAREIRQSKADAAFAGLPTKPAPRHSWRSMKPVLLGAPG